LFNIFQGPYSRSVQVIHTTCYELIQKKNYPLNSEFKPTICKNIWKGKRIGPCLGSGVWKRVLSRDHCFCYNEHLQHWARDGRSKDQDDDGPVLPPLLRLLLQQRNIATMLTPDPREQPWGNGTRGPEGDEKPCSQGGRRQSRHLLCLKEDFLSTTTTTRWLEIKTCNTYFWCILMVLKFLSKYYPTSPMIWTEICSM